MPKKTFVAFVKRTTRDKTKELLGYTWQNKEIRITKEFMAHKEKKKLSFLQSSNGKLKDRCFGGKLSLYFRNLETLTTCCDLSCLHYYVLLCKFCAQTHPQEKSAVINNMNYQTKHVIILHFTEIEDHQSLLGTEMSNGMKNDHSDIIWSVYKQPLLKDQ